MQRAAKLFFKIASPCRPTKLPCPRSACDCCSTRYFVCHCARCRNSGLHRYFGDDGTNGRPWKRQDGSYTTQLELAHLSWINPCKGRNVIQNCLPPRLVVGGIQNVAESTVENLAALDVADSKVIAVNLGSYRSFLFRLRVRKPSRKSCSSSIYSPGYRLNRHQHLPGYPGALSDSRSPQSEFAGIRSRRPQWGRTSPDWAVCRHADAAQDSTCRCRLVRAHI
jgi:hypothetical protein